MKLKQEGDRFHKTVSFSINMFFMSVLKFKCSLCTIKRMSNAILLRKHYNKITLKTWFFKITFERIHILKIFHSSPNQSSRNNFIHQLQTAFHDKIYFKIIKYAGRYVIITIWVTEVFFSFVRQLAVKIMLNELLTALEKAQLRRK